MKSSGASAIVARALMLAVCGLPQTGSEKPAAVCGQVVREPERVSGLWEADVGGGSVIGIEMALTTRVEGAPTSLDSVTQYQDHLMIGVYERKGKAVEVGEESYFMDEPGGGMKWDGGRLVIQSLQTLDGLAAVEADLIFDEQSENWTGRIRRGDVNRKVVLRRPGAAKAVGSRFAGTWINDRGGLIECLHIAKAGDGVTAGWVDRLQEPGRWRYANGIQPPKETYERYGSMVEVTEVSPDAFVIDLVPHRAGGNPRTVTGRLSEGDTKFGPDRDRAVAGFPELEMWKKVSGDSCR